MNLRFETYSTSDVSSELLCCCAVIESYSECNEHDETTAAEVDDDDDDECHPDDRMQLTDKRLHRRRLFADCHAYSEGNARDQSSTASSVNAAVDCRL